MAARKLSESNNSKRPPDLEVKDRWKVVKKKFEELETRVTSPGVVQDVKDSNKDWETFEKLEKALK